MARTRFPQLTVGGYTALQKFVHRGHRATVRKLVELMEARPGETVVEIGCGTGLLGRHFIELGFDYWGVDPDEQRIEAARSVAGGHFITGDAWVLAANGVPTGCHVFIHGVLHHLDDAYCTSLIDFLLDWSATNRIVVSEPVRPDHWWLNPAGVLAAALDEGDYVRTKSEWLSLFRPSLESVSVRSLWPRWPMSMLDVRLQKQNNGAGGRAMASKGSG